MILLHFIITLIAFIGILIIVSIQSFFELGENYFPVEVEGRILDYFGFTIIILSFIMSFVIN